MKLLLLLEEMGQGAVMEGRQESGPPQVPPHLCEDSARSWRWARQEERFSPEPNQAGTVISNFQPL